MAHHGGHMPVAAAEGAAPAVPHTAQAADPGLPSGHRGSVHLRLDQPGRLCRRHRHPGGAHHPIAHL